MPKIDFDVIFSVTQKMPSLPQTTLQALQIIEDPEFNVEKLSKILGLDQTLAGKLLQWANSPFYGLRYRVATLEQAIMVMGTVAVRDLLLTVSVSEMLNKKMVGYGMERGALWRHAIAVAFGSRWLAEENKYTHADQVFIAGLLHDIGKLILDELLCYDPDWQSEWMLLQEKGASFMELERWLTGMDHAQLGGRIAEEWNLPATLAEAIACHHSPQLATIEPKVTRWIHLADAAALMLGVGLGTDGLNYVINEHVLDQEKNAHPEFDFEELMQIEAQAVEEAENILRT